MKFDLISDMHVDLWREKNDPIRPGNDGWDQQSDTLVVAGDVANSPTVAVDTLRVWAKDYRKVFYVDGNHEYYDRRWPQSHAFALMAFYLRKEKNITFLSDTEHEVIEGVTFVGVNGWYDWNAGPGDLDSRKKMWMRYSGDRQIDTDAGDPSVLAKRDVDRLCRNLEGLERPLVVVTHTLPRWELVSPRFVNDALSASFVNTRMQDALKIAKPSVWCYGHTHDRGDRDIDGVRYVANPRGYRGENPGWSVVTIEVGE